MADDEVAPLMSAFFTAPDEAPKEIKWISMDPANFTFTDEPETTIKPKYYYTGTGKSYYAEQYYEEKYAPKSSGPIHGYIHDALDNCVICEAFAKPYPSGPPAKKSVPAALAESIPAIKEEVKPNCDCYKTGHYADKYGPDYRVKIYDQVVHLNDQHRWTREAIADWLDTLDADLQFKLPESPESTERDSG